MTTTGIFPTILFYDYVLSFAFENYSVVIFVLWMHFDLDIVRFFVDCRIEVTYT